MSVEIKKGMVRHGDRLAIQSRERTSNVPTRYRIAWSVFRFVAFCDNSPESIGAACVVSLPGMGLVSVWLEGGAQFHYALVEKVADGVTKRQAMAALAA